MTSFFRMASAKVSKVAAGMTKAETARHFGITECAISRRSRRLGLAFFAVIVLYPLLLIVSTSVKDPLDVTANPFALFSSVNLVNFVDAWTIGGFGGYFWNTVIITASPGAYENSPPNWIRSSRVPSVAYSPTVGSPPQETSQLPSDRTRAEP